MTELGPKPAATPVAPAQTQAGYEPPVVRCLGSAADLLANGLGSCIEAQGDFNANRASGQCVG